MKWRAEARGGPLLLLACAALSACAGGDHRLVADAPVKIGRPYTAAGIRYVPADDPAYDEVGLASWYGREHQNDRTANGERFRRKRVSAAHATLPMPSYVAVTALATGRTILVRINDRGPFARGRIIDLSERAAELLGLTRTDDRRVRVRRAYPSEADARALRSGRPAAPLASVR